MTECQIKNTNILPIRCIVKIIAENTAEVPLHNHKTFQGALYQLCTEIDPLFTYKFKNTGDIKAWTWNIPKFDHYCPVVNRKGFYTIQKGTMGVWKISTIDPDIYRILMSFSMDSKHDLHLGSLKCRIVNVLSQSVENPQFPENISTISLHIHSPAFLTDLNGTDVSLTDKHASEYLIRSQCSKMKRLGIMELNAEELYPYCRILVQSCHLTSHTEYITKEGSKNVIPISGHVGTLVIKLEGDMVIKKILWQFWWLSQFTGIGSRTSMGFGNCTMHWKSLMEGN